MRAISSLSMSIELSDGTENDRDHGLSWVPKNSVDYATAPGPHGPWTYQGVLLAPDEDAGVRGTGHHSILNLPGTDDWIIAYHRWATIDGSGWRREVMFAPIGFDAVGRMQPIRPTTTWYRHPLSEKDGVRRSG